MARRKAKSKTRRKDKAISITGMAEALMLANVGTNAVFGLSAYDWIADGWTTATQGKAYGPGQLSLHELIYSNKTTTPKLTLGSQSYGGVGAAALSSNAEVMVSNLQANWMPALIQSVAIPIGFRIGKRVLRKPITMGNKALKAAGIRGMVKI
jgi:hypothetical protein